MCMVGKIAQTSVCLGGGILWVSPNSGRIKHQNTICRILSTGELKNGVSQKMSSLNGPKLALSASHSLTQKCKRELMPGFTTTTRSSTQSGIGPGQLSRYSDSLRTGRSRDRITVGARFSAPVQTGSGAHLAHYTMGTGSFQVVERPGRGVDHPPHLELRLKKE
jgi:hypothetical protein